MRDLALNIVGSTLVFLVLFGCQKKDSFNDILIIGHAGNGLENINTFFHDNSLKSIELALQTNGCDGIELDVQISLDGTLWLYHDPNLSSETNGAGCIPDLNDEYLETLHYSTLEKERLIKLAEIPSELMRGRTLYIDTRTISSCTESEIDVASFLVAMNHFREANIAVLDIVIITGSVDWLSVFKADGFNVIVQIASMTGYQQLIASFPLINGVVVANQNISKEDVSLIQSNGREVVIFNMRAASSIRKALKKLPNAIMTDNLKNAIIEKY